MATFLLPKGDKKVLAHNSVGSSSISRISSSSLVRKLNISSGSSTYLNDISYTTQPVRPTTVLLHTVCNAAPTPRLIQQNVIPTAYDTIIDTGATTHILRDLQYASMKYKYQPTATTVALGDHGVQLAAIGKVSVGILLHALVVPKMSLNLISMSMLEKVGYALLIYKRSCSRNGTRGVKTVLDK